MKIIIAPASFKECLTATQVARHISCGIHSVYPSAQIIRIPIANGGELIQLAKINTSGVTQLLSKARMIAACDVTNPLCGHNGASAVFGPQKGATPEMVEKLDQNLKNLAHRIEADLGKSVAETPDEGKIDFQTQFGKTPFGVAQIASKYKVPVIALAGMIGEGAEALLEKGITAYFALADKPMSMEESKENSGQLLKKTTEQIMRVITI